MSLTLSSISVCLRVAESFSGTIPSSVLNVNTAFNDSSPKLSGNVTVADFSASTKIALVNKLLVSKSPNKSKAPDKSMFSSEQISCALLDSSSKVVTALKSPIFI